MVEALRGKLDGGGLQLFCVSSVDGESWYARGMPARQRVERHLQYESYILGDVVPLIRQVNGTRRHRRDRLQLRGVSRHGDGAAPPLHLHVVHHHQRRLRHQPVPRRLTRPRRLPAQPAVVPAGARRRVLPGPVPAQQVRPGHRRMGHLPRRQRGLLAAARRQGHPALACTCGVSAHSTTGRTGCRWPAPTCLRSGARGSGPGGARGKTDSSGLDPAAPRPGRAAGPCPDPDLSSGTRSTYGDHRRPVRHGERLPRRTRRAHQQPARAGCGRPSSSGSAAWR